jgi:hypothetical protein
MVGSPEQEEKGLPEKVRETMFRFDVDEKRARQLLGYSAILASENFAKWKTNLRRIQLLKAEEILKLVETAKKGDLRALDEAEVKLQAILKTKSWEK